MIDSKRSMLKLVKFAAAMLSVVFTVGVSAQDSLQKSSLDLLDDDFFDTLSSNPDVADQERPKAPVLDLPATMDEVPIFNGESASPEIQAWARWLILKNLPPVYEDNRKWGVKKEVYDGFRFRHEGLKVETYRKYKTVKQGTWTRYFIEFVDPEENLKLTIADLRQIDRSKISFRVVVSVPLHIFGRIAQWQHDVQLVSISTNADATVEMSVACECDILINPLAFPPDVSFKPHATEASIVMTSFEVHRISQLRGVLAEQLGKGLRHGVDEKLSEYGDKLVVKINRQFEKQADRLHVRFQDKIGEAVGRWTGGE